MALPVQMRATPAITPSGGSQVNITGQTVGPLSSYVLLIATQGAAVGGFIYNGNYTASADL
jgi:hypothetical protein